MEMAIPYFDRHARLLQPGSAAQLVAEAKGGSLSAFDRLMVLHEQPVLRFAQRLLLNREAARDASQEVFLRLYRNLRRIDENVDLAPWLYRTTSNVCFDMLKKAKSDLCIDVLPEPASRDSDPEESAKRLQRQQVLTRGLRALSAREREAVILRDLEGYSTGEVARLLGVSEETIRSHVSRGRVKLHDYLAARGIGI